MDRDSADLFTAAEIANALNCKRQTMRSTLTAIVCDGEKLVGGNLAHAWRIKSLPPPLRARLDQRAIRAGFSNVYRLLRNAPQTFVPALSLKEAASVEVEAARKLQQSLAICWRLSDDTPTAELARAAAPEYRRIFGYGVSDRHLRELITRTISRDGGNRNFARIEIYFSERPQKRAETIPCALDDSLGFAELDESIASDVSDRTTPSATEIAYCWRKIVQCYTDRVTAGATPKAVEKALRDYIVRSAPFLAENAMNEPITR